MVSTVRVPGCSGKVPVTETPKPPVWRVAWHEAVSATILPSAVVK